MTRYSIQCVNRETGAEYRVLVDAANEHDAREWAIGEGHMVGRVSPLADGAATDHSAMRGPNEAHAAQPAANPPDPRQAMIDAARAWHKSQTETGGGGASTADMRRIADALDRIAASPMVARPRRTMILCVMIGMAVGGVAVTLLQFALGIGAIGAMGGASASPQQLNQLQGAVKQIGDLYNEAVNDPLGNKKP